ncbi:MAG: DNA-binding protein [bacterium]
MQYRSFEEGWIIRLETGEAVAETLHSFLEEHGVKSGDIRGIGAVRWALLGYFDQEAGEYRDRRFEGGFELLSLLGNVSVKSDGSVFAHMHTTLCGPDFQVIGGHLFDAEVGPTLEIYLRRGGGEVQRRTVPGQELELLDL